LRVLVTKSMFSINLLPPA